MTDPKFHDPLCPRHRWHKSFYITCQCNLIREVEQRERQKIAAAIEAHARTVGYPEIWSAPAMRNAAFMDAARIARNGSSDDSSN